MCFAIWASRNYCSYLQTLTRFGLLKNLCRFFFPPKIDYLSKVTSPEGFHTAVSSLVLIRKFAGQASCSVPQPAARRTSGHAVLTPPGLAPQLKRGNTFPEHGPKDKKTLLKPPLKLWQTSNIDDSQPCSVVVTDPESHFSLVCFCPLLHPLSPKHGPKDFYI